MAYLFRPTQTKPLPPGAEIFTRKGERFARYTDRKGKPRTARVTDAKTGEPKLLIESPLWRVRYRDGAGVIRTVPTGCRQEDTARSVMNDLVRRAELVKANVISATEDAAADHADLPIAEHFDGYVGHLTAKGNAPHRINQIRARLDRIATDCGFNRLSQLRAGELERWLVARQGDNMAAATRNGYREAIVGFGNWCRRTKRLMANPFLDVPMADVKSDRRRIRRSLTEDELVKLIEIARTRPLTDALMLRTGKRKGQSAANVRPEVREQLEAVGRERALIYKTLVLTGLRKGELASITAANIDLDAPTPCLILDAADEKNRQGADIPLRADLVADLRSWVGDKLKALQDRARLKIGEPMPMRLPADTLLFNVPTGLIRILDRDLVAAGIARLVKDAKTGKTVIAKRDERGRTIDVHALRTTFGTHLSKGGVSLRTAQAAMRHSKPELTANCYTDPKLLDVAGALNALPALPLHPRRDRQEARQTGTDQIALQIALPIALPVGNSGGIKGMRGNEGTTTGSESTGIAPIVSALSVNKNGSQSTQDYEPLLKAGEGGRTLDIHVGNIIRHTHQRTDKFSTYNSR